METTLYLELWQGNTKKYLYKLIRNRNNNFTHKNGHILEILEDLKHMILIPKP